MRHVSRVTERLGLIQIDSVNVLARAHLVPFFSRLGPYDTAHLERLAYGGRKRRLFEYWGHEASLIRVELQPHLRWRMERARAGQGIYGGLARFRNERPDFILGMKIARLAKLTQSQRSETSVPGRNPE